MQAPLHCNQLSIRHDSFLISGSITSNKLTAPRAQPSTDKYALDMVRSRLSPPFSGQPGCPRQPRRPGTPVSSSHYSQLWLPPMFSTAECRVLILRLYESTPARHICWVPITCKHVLDAGNAEMKGTHAHHPITHELSNTECVSRREKWEGVST